jgi:hypothetical protein
MMMKNGLRVLSLAAALATAACGGGGEGAAGSGAGGGGGGGRGGGAADPPTFTNVQKILTTSCALSTSCHKGMRPKADLNLEPGMAYLNLLGSDPSVGTMSCEFPGMNRVVPGDPDASLLVAKLTTPPAGAPDMACTSAGGKNERMPMSNDALPMAQIALIRDWVAAGALDD